MLKKAFNWLVRVSSFRNDLLQNPYFKRGTVILKEDAQMPVLDVEVQTLLWLKREDDPETISPESEFIKDSEPWMNFIEKVLAFFNKMKKSDQKEYLELFNCLDDRYDHQRESSRFKENLVMWIEVPPSKKRCAMWKSEVLLSSSAPM